jgi:uncharacterized protein YjbI with pentapeptide repeats
MNEFRENSNIEIPKNITREWVENKLNSDKRREAFEGMDLKDLDLTGLDLSGRSFRGSDVRGLCLFRGEIPAGETDEITNIENTDWTDAIIEAYAPSNCEFASVRAENSVFGFSETLFQKGEKMAEKEKQGSKVEPIDRGMYLGFNGSRGNFKNSKWNNIDFQGGNEYGAMFYHANLSGAKFDGCDLKGLNWSLSNIEGIEINIYDPDSLTGFIINQRQVHSLVKAIKFMDKAYREGIENEMKKKTAEDVLWDSFGVNVVQIDENDLEEEKIN